MEFKKNLSDEIVREIEVLSTLEPGTEQYEKTVNGVYKLLDKSIEIDKLEADIDAKDKDREHDRIYKDIEVEENKKSKWIDRSFQLLGILASTGLTVWGTKTILKFEIDGTVTSSIGRAFINKLLPRK